MKMRLAPAVEACWVARRAENCKRPEDTAEEEKAVRMPAGENDD